MHLAFYTRASLGACAFAPDASGHVTIPGGTTSLANRAFQDCNVANTFPYLTTISLPASLQTIGDQAFENCDGLLSIDLSGTSVIGIGTSAFKGCTSLGTVILPASLRTIKSSAFYNVPITSIDLSGTSMTQLKSNTLCSLSPADSILTNITLPASLTTLDNQAFRNCKELLSLDLSATSITSFGYQVCTSCHKLHTLKLPPTLTSIGDMACEYCNALAAVDLGSLTSLATIGMKAFRSANLLADIGSPLSLIHI